MAYDDEKKERAKIRKEIDKKEEERDELKKSKEKLEKEKTKMEEEKKKFETVKNQSTNATGFLNNAINNLNRAQDSYKKNFQGDAASSRLSSFSNAISSIQAIKDTLLKIKAEAQIQITKLTTKIADNTRIIGDYNNKIREYDREISHLSNKL